MRSPARHPVSCLLTIVLAGTALGCGEEAGAPTAPAAEQGSASVVQAAALAFIQVSAGQRHTCGVTTANRAYCWGYNGAGQSGGQLGDGTSTRRLAPVPVAGNLKFKQVSAGVEHSCGITTDNRAWCWGRNDWGQLGNGSAGATESQFTPVAVAGGRRFSQISAAYYQTCAVNPSNVVFCWGTNQHGVLGNGIFESFTPARVAGSHKFLTVSAGFSHVCGVTTNSQAWCWGNGIGGSLGNGTGRSSGTPVRVLGNIAFREVHAGSGYIAPASDDQAPDDTQSCGLASDNRAWCWGTSIGSTPQLVPGDKLYRTYSAGTTACGVNEAGNIFCWNSLGLTRIDAGSVRFSSVSVSGIRGHRCAVSKDNRAFCWGENTQGQLGNGTTDNSPTPVPVSGG